MTEDQEKEIAKTLNEISALLIDFSAVVAKQALSIAELKLKVHALEKSTLETSGNLAHICRSNQEFQQ